MNDAPESNRSRRWLPIGTWVLAILVCAGILALRTQWLKSPMVFQAVGSRGFISFSTASTPPGYVVGVFYRTMHNLSHPLVLLAYTMVSGLLCLALRAKGSVARLYVALILTHLAFAGLYAVSLFTVIEYFGA